MNKNHSMSRNITVKFLTTNTREDPKSFTFKKIFKSRMALNLSSQIRVKLEAIIKILADEQAIKNCHQEQLILKKP